MRIEDIEPPLNGDSLQSALIRAKNKRGVIADGLLYEQTILMVAADPGAGKSTISTQVAVELAAGLPVFGIFKPPRPMKILYVQTERSIIEFLERLDVIGKVLPINRANIYATDEYQKMNLINAEHSRTFISCVLRDCPDVDVIFLDPIYSMVSGGLKDDIPASAFTKAMSLLQKETGAMLWYNHHTVKQQYSNTGGAIEKEDPFYGSQWIKAHVTGSYYMKKDGDGVKMLRKKDNYNLLPGCLDLEYNPETGLCCIPLEEAPAIERVKVFLRAKEMDRREFTFKDLEVATGLCTRTVREVIAHSSIKERMEIVSSIRNKNLYRISSQNPSCAVQ